MAACVGAGAAWRFELPSDGTVKTLLGFGGGALPVYVFLWSLLGTRFMTVLRIKRTELLGMNKVQLSDAYDAARSAQWRALVLTLAPGLILALCLPTAIDILREVDFHLPLSGVRSFFELLTAFWTGLTISMLVMSIKLRRRVTSLRQRVEP